MLDAARLAVTIAAAVNRLLILRRFIRKASEFPRERIQPESA